MDYYHVFEPRAQLEYEDTILWYDERSEQARKNFQLEIDEKLREICRHPKRYRNTKKYFRETFLDKYPYSIIYFINEEDKTIVVTSIFHSSRNPQDKFIR